MQFRGIDVFDLTYNMLAGKYWVQLRKIVAFDSNIFTTCCKRPTVIHRVKCTSIYCEQRDSWPSVRYVKLRGNGVHSGFNEVSII